MKVKSKIFKEILVECMDSGYLNAPHDSVVNSIFNHVKDIEDEKDIEICESLSTDDEHFIKNCVDVGGVILQLNSSGENYKQFIIEEIKRMIKEHNINSEDLFDATEDTESHDNSNECSCKECDNDCPISFATNEEVEMIANSEKFAVNMIDKNSAEKYIGKLPVVFLATADRTFGAGIAKFYADKYPKMRDANCGDKTDYLSIYRMHNLLEQDECCLDTIGQSNDNIMFCVLTPKVDRHSTVCLPEFEDSLNEMFKTLIENGIKEIAMPKMGSKRENMDWSNTKQVIERIAKNYGSIVFWID